MKVKSTPSLALALGVWQKFEQNLWTSVVKIVNKSFEQELWTKVLNQSYRQVLWTKVMNIICEGNLLPKAGNKANLNELGLTVGCAWQKYSRSKECDKMRQ